MNKKSIMCIFLSFAFSVALLSPNVFATGFNLDSTKESIRAFIYTFDNIEADVEYRWDLKDINGNYSFALYEIKNNGYAIAAKTNGNIVDIKYGNLPSNEDIYYLGPNTFTSHINISQTRNSLSNESNDNIRNVTNKILSEDKIEFTFEKNLRTSGVRPQPGKPGVISGGTEVGIAETRIDLFNNSTWRVAADSCGAYMGAAMVTYMDKYFGGNYIRETQPINNSADYASYIITRFRKYINGGVTTFKVLNTINTIMMNDYPTGGKSGSTTATESTYKSKINGQRPVIFFLPSWKPGNTYGGHFVLGYKYVDYNGALWFKAYDGYDENNHRGWINRNWIENGIYLN